MSAVPPEQRSDPDVLWLRAQIPFFANLVEEGKRLGDPDSEILYHQEMVALHERIATRLSQAEADARRLDAMLASRSEPQGDEKQAGAAPLGAAMSEHTSVTKSDDPLFVSTGHWATSGRSATSSHPLAGLYNSSSAMASRYFFLVPPSLQDIEVDRSLGMSAEEAARRGGRLEDVVDDLESASRSEPQGDEKQAGAAPSGTEAPSPQPSPQEKRDIAVIRATLLWMEHTMRVAMTEGDDVLAVGPDESDAHSPEAVYASICLDLPRVSSSPAPEARVTTPTVSDFTPNDAFGLLRSYSRHRDFVRLALTKVQHALEERAIQHDASKMSDDEFAGFARINAAARTNKFGSPEYKEAMQRERSTILKHFSRNTHHAEYFSAEADSDSGWRVPAQPMSFLDVIEMVCDWWGARKGYDDKRSWKETVELNFAAKGKYLSPEQAWLAREVAAFLGVSETPGDA